jgi:hypothetical protein
MAKQAEDTKTGELPGLTRRGRPPAGDRAMTAAERQRAYRERLAEERHGGKPSDLSRVTLMRQLNDCFDQIDRKGAKLGELKADIDEGARYLAEQILAELVTRYELDVYSIKRKAAPRSK